MGHPQIDNASPFTFEPVFLSDEEGRPLLVPFVKATYDLTSKGPALALEQSPMLAAGVAHGEPGKSSYRYEPEGSLPKPATDVVLVGSAVAPRVGTTELLVAFQVGELKKGVRVFGDRILFGTIAGMSKPAPFERIPLLWELAFGGWDRSRPDEAHHSFEPRNPVGVGFCGSGSVFQEGLRCPNLEDPAHPYHGWGDRPTPAGFGFVSPDWEPRRRLAGTYDEHWLEERAPLLPKDFDPRFLNGAAAGLVAPGYLRGDEQVVASNVTASGSLAFKLPGVAPPTIEVEHAGRDDARVGLNLDTVIVDTDDLKLFLYWRGRIAVREPTAVRTIRVVPGAGTPPKPEA